MEGEGEGKQLELGSHAVVVKMEEGQLFDMAVHPMMVDRRCASLVHCLNFLYYQLHYLETQVHHQLQPQLQRQQNPLSCHFHENP